MWVISLKLQHFRNYERLDVQLCPGLNVFLGDNGSGKTNILEAITFLSRGRSRRSRVDKDMVQWHQPAMGVSITVAAHYDAQWQETIEARCGETPSLETPSGTPASSTMRSRFKWNDKPLKSRSELVGRCPTVSFFLNDLLLLRGAPDDRRTALDTLLSQVDKAYLDDLTRFQRLKDQKNQLLKQASAQSGPMAMESANLVVDSLNEQLIPLCVRIMQKRLTLLQAFEPKLQALYHTISDGKEVLTVSYLPAMSKYCPTLDVDMTLSAIDASGLTQPDTLELLYRQAFAAARQDEWRRGQLLIGPHRDDLGFALDGHAATQFASQGQQRSIVLALKLAELEWITQHFQGEPPILLLDDVMAELDPKRQHQLLTHMGDNGQVLVTTTHLDNDLEATMKRVGHASLFHVSKGQLTPDVANSIQPNVAVLAS